MLNEKEVLESVEQSIYGPEYQKENMTSRVEREINYSTLACKLASTNINAFRLLSCVNTHLSSLRLPSDELIEKFYVSKAHAKEALETNVLDITPEFIYYYSIINPTNYSEKKRANYKARQLCKELVKEGVLYNIKTPKTKDRYLVNPMYIYFHKDSSCKFGTVYLQWADCNGITIEPNDPNLKGVYKRNKKSTNRPSTIDDPITAAYKQEQEANRISKQTEEYSQAEQKVQETIAASKPSTEPYQVVQQSVMIEGPEYLKQQINNSSPKPPKQPAVATVRGAEVEYDLSKPWTLPEDHPDFNPF